jgi:hypothetical protein
MYRTLSLALLPLILSTEWLKEIKNQTSSCVRGRKVSWFERRLSKQQTTKRHEGNSDSGDFLNPLVQIWSSWSYRRTISWKFGSKDTDWGSPCMNVFCKTSSHTFNLSTPILRKEKCTLFHRMLFYSILTDSKFSLPLKVNPHMWLWN